jgi:hypothetical protein
MGFTRYWDIPKEVKQEDYEKALASIKKCLAKLPKHSDSAGGSYSEKPLEIFDGNGKGEAEFSSKCICFNGNEEGDLKHETFYFSPTEKDDIWSFCKTARKPYDYVVVICLLALRDNIAGFKYSSDGNSADDKGVVAFYNKNK